MIICFWWRNWTLKQKSMKSFTAKIWHSTTDDWCSCWVWEILAKKILPVQMMTSESMKRDGQGSIPQDHLTTNSGRVTLNIGGQIYETNLETLQRFPDSLLGNTNKREKYYNLARRQYFLDRNRIFFDAIFFFYQSGMLRCPSFIPYELFLEECRFFELPEEVILGKTRK